MPRTQIGSKEDDGACLFFFLSIFTVPLGIYPRVESHEVEDATPPSHIFSPPQTHRANVRGMPATPRVFRSHLSI